MARIWVAILTLFIYALAQFLPLVLAQTPIFNRLSGMALARAGVYTQVILFILAAILIIFLHFKIKNPTNLEQEHKESKRYIIPFRSTTTKSKYSTNNGCSKTTPYFYYINFCCRPYFRRICI